MTGAPLEITVQALAALRGAGADHILLDVREPWEVEMTAIPDSLAIPMQQIPVSLDRLPKDRPIVVTCHHGGRSMRVTQYLRAQGYDQVSNLAGGVDGWAAEIDPTMTRY